MITISNIHKSFKKNNVLKGVSMDVRQGEVIVVIGPSGSGKTTFLRCINFLERPDAGEICIGDLKVNAQHPTKNEIFQIRRRTAMVFQSYNLFSNKTALQNVMEGPVIVQKRLKASSEEQAKELLNMVGLADKYESDSNCYFWFRPDDTQLRDDVSTALLKLREDGTLSQLSEEWLGVDYASQIDASSEE